MVPYVVSSAIPIATPNDVLRFIDPVQTKLVTRTSNGIYFTRDASKLNVTTPKWYKIASHTNVENFEFSKDGNHLFMGTSSGQVIRISGLSAITHTHTHTHTHKLNGMITYTCNYLVKFRWGCWLSFRS